MELRLPPQIEYWLTGAKHDCFFTVGSENGKTERIGVVKHILLGYSEPLRAMLQDSELAEQGDVPLIDVEPDTFKSFLMCVYGASDIVISRLTFDKCAKLLYVAEKYLVHEVKTKATKRLVELFSPEKIFLALSHQICLNEKVLASKILRILQCDFDKVVSDIRFFDLSYFSLMWILQQDRLEATELAVWIAVLKWAEHKTKSKNGCVLRTEIFGLIKYIRFLTMDIQEFCRYVVPTEVLQKEEVDAIYQSLDTDHPPSIDHLCKNMIPRYDSSFEVHRMAINYSGVVCSATGSIFNTVTIDNINNGRFKSKPLNILGSQVFTKVKKAKIEDHRNVLCFTMVCPLDCDVSGKIVIFNQYGNQNVTLDFNKVHGRRNISRVQCDWDQFVSSYSGFIKNKTFVIKTYIKINNVIQL